MLSEIAAYEAYQNCRRGDHCRADKTGNGRARGILRVTGESVVREERGLFLHCLGLCRGVTRVTVIIFIKAEVRGVASLLIAEQRPLKPVRGLSLQTGRTLRRQALRLPQAQQ